MASFTPTDISIDHIQKITPHIKFTDVSGSTPAAVQFCAKLIWERSCQGRNSNGHDCQTVDVKFLFHSLL